MIEKNFHEVEFQIEKCKQQRTHVPQDAPVKLIAVTKNHDLAAMREAIAAGATDVGENRIQEAKEKFEILGHAVTWHLIGHLQTNKVKTAVRIFDLIHSVDTLHLAEVINKEAAKIGKVQDILVQVNLAKEKSKSGVFQENLLSMLDAIDSMDHIRLCGLMCIAPNYDQVEECRPLFQKMYEIYRQVKEISYRTANIKYLSMGMTHDYAIAVEEGSNMVRVGTAIFGPRQYE